MEGDVQGDVRLYSTGDERFPRFVAFVNDLGGVLSVLGLARKSELVLRLSIGDPTRQTLSQWMKAKRGKGGAYL